MTERWEQRLRDLHVETPSDMWWRIQEGPRNEPPIGRPPPRQRVAAAAVAVAVFVGAAVFAWQAFRPDATTVGASSPTPPPGMSVYTDPLGWTAFYPSDWSVTTVKQTFHGLDAGVRIQNLAFIETSLIRRGVVLTVTHPLDAAPDPSAGSSSFPLSASDFEVKPGPPNASLLQFSIDGVLYLATLRVGSAAPSADATAMGEVIASIRPISPSPAQPIPGTIALATQHGIYGSLPGVVVPPSGAVLVSPTRLAFVTSGSGSCPSLPITMEVLSSTKLRMEVRPYDPDHGSCTADLSTTTVEVAIDPRQIDVTHELTIELVYPSGPPITRTSAGLG